MKYKCKCRCNANKCKRECSKSTLKMDAISAIAEAFLVTKLSAIAGFTHYILGRQ